MLPLWESQGALLPALGSTSLNFIINEFIKILKIAYVHEKGAPRLRIKAANIYHTSANLMFNGGEKIILRYKKL